MIITQLHGRRSDDILEPKVVQVTDWLIFSGPCARQHWQNSGTPMNVVWVSAKCLSRRRKRHGAPSILDSGLADRN